MDGDCLKTKLLDELITELPFLNLTSLVSNGWRNTRIEFAGHVEARR